MMYVGAAAIAILCGGVAGWINYNASYGPKKGRLIFGITSGILLGLVSFLCFVS